MGDFGSNIVASVIGGLIVLALGWGGGITRLSLKARRTAAQAERTAWLEGGATARQAITERYLFRILGALFVANALWVLPDIAFNALSARYFSAPAPDSVSMAMYVFATSANALAALFFLYGFGTILRYSRLRSRVLPDGQAQPKEAAA